MLTLDQPIKLDMTEDKTPAALAEQYIKYTNKSVFLTGKAGTGKTTLLHKLRNELIKNYMVVAPTGIAAINAKGTTLHSQFGLPIGTFIPDVAFNNTNDAANVFTPKTMFKQLRLSDEKRRLIKELDLLIIDEVSMLRADLLDCLDNVLRSVRQKRHLPLGGVQVLFIGDLMQLPPVVKEHEKNILGQYYKSPFFFDAHVVTQLEPMYIELDKIYRQTDVTFIELLNNLRQNKITQNDLNILNSYVRHDVNDNELFNVITLTTHNNTADSLNHTALEKIAHKSETFKAEIEGIFPEHMYPIDVNLQLKIDAQVMFIKNDTSQAKRYFNGKIGKIIAIYDDFINVEFEDGSTVTVERHTWNNIKYELNEATKELEEKVIGEFVQFPLRLAWAITVHKSQGLTFEKAILDINHAFAAGQVYVALSRLKSLDGLILRENIHINQIPQSASLQEHQNSKISPDELHAQLGTYTHAYIRYLVLSSYKMGHLVQNVQSHSDSYPQGENSTKQKYISWAQELVTKVRDFAPHAAKFDAELHTHLDLHDYTKIIERCEQANNYFIPKLEGISDFILQHLVVLSSEKGTKAYGSELLDLESEFYQLIIKLHKLSHSLQAIIHKTDDLPKFNIKSANERIQRIQEISKSTVNDYNEKYKRKKEPKAKKEPKIATHIQTLELLKSGLDIEGVALRRSLAASTIMGHVLRLVRSKEIDGRKYIEIEKMEVISRLYGQNPDGENIVTQIKSKLGDEYSFEEVRLAVAIVDCENGK